MIIDNKTKLKNVIVELYQTISDFQIAEFTSGEGAVLLYLYQNDEGVYPSVLSSFLDVSRARVTNIINVLNQKKYVEMVNDVCDRRKIKVYITEFGKKYIESKVEMVDQFFNRFLDTVGDDIEDVISNIKYITKLFKNIGEVGENE